jgi:hypothetical protein
MDVIRLECDVATSINARRQGGTDVLMRGKSYNAQGNALANDRLNEVLTVRSI